MGTRWGHRTVNGRVYLMDGRYTGLDAREQAAAAADRKRKQGFYAIIRKHHAFDWAVYTLSKR